jgi:hypothetical protein
MNRDLLLSGLDHIIFDVDGKNQQSYEQYRRNGRLDKVLDNMLFLNELRNDLGKTKPLIEARFIAMQHNIGEIEEVRQLSIRHGADRFTVKKCITRKEEEFPDAEEFIPINFNRKSFETPNSCGYLYVFFMILSNGKTSPCCYDEYGEYSLGDIAKITVEESLNSKAFMALRHNVRTFSANDPRRLELCKSCDLSRDIYGEPSPN